MHPVDRIMALAFRHGPRSLKTFTSGWGDEHLIELMRVDPRQIEAPQPIDIEWAESVNEQDYVVTEGAFRSPEHRLPAGARHARVRMLAPLEPDGRLAVMMAAWNDHGYRPRQTLAGRLAQRGIAGVMLENPFYGSRRVIDDPPIRTVADFALMGRAAVAEGRALLGHFAGDFQVGVTGYSMGGNIAALIGATMDGPVAIAALAASHSPGPVWIDGIIQNMIDWEALGGRNQKERLRDTLTHASVLSLPARDHTKHAVIVGSRSDGYIPAEAVEALHDHWPGSELRWLPGGHATMMVVRKRRLVDAIVASFDRMFGST